MLLKTKIINVNIYLTTYDNIISQTLYKMKTEVIFLNGYQLGGLIVGGIGALCAFISPVLFKLGEGQTLSNEQIEKMMDIINQANLEKEV